MHDTGLRVIWGSLTCPPHPCHLACPQLWRSQAFTGAVSIPPPDPILALVNAVVCKSSNSKTPLIHKKRLV